MMCHKRLGAVWVLLAAAAAVQLSDEPTELDELVYQDRNDIDTGPLRELHAADIDPTRLREILLLRLISSRVRDERDTEHRMPRDLSRSLGWSNAARTLAKRFIVSGGRPQQRWKTKKGKVIGSQMVCYFKLCAFRNPT